MSLSDRLEARRRAEMGEESPPSEADVSGAYNELAEDLAARVARLSVYRSRSDRARLINQLTGIDRRVHAMLERLGGGPSV
jgi:hypothetical protein